MTQTENRYKCQNRHCRQPILKSGRCEVCERIWTETCQRAQEAYEQERWKNETTHLQDWR